MRSGKLKCLPQTLTLNLPGLRVDGMELKNALGDIETITFPMMHASRTGSDTDRVYHPGGVHTIFGKPGLLHSSPVCPWEPSSQESAGPQNARQVNHGLL